MRPHTIQSFFTFKRTRWLVSAMAIVVLVVAGTVPAFANLPGSTFEANDGNMTVDTAGNNDWNSVQSSPNYVHLTDLSNTSGDDSFKPGQKQDTVCPVIVASKNPPKDDFTDVASFSQTILDSTSPEFRHTFLDGATIRFAPNGNASENVELNKGTNGNCGTDPVTGVTLLARSAGDKLIAIDYLNGGTSVQFHVLVWIVDSSDPTNSTCFVKTDSPPCWGSNVQSLSANAAEGAVNQSPIIAGDNKISNTALDTGEFAEFGVDLTAAGIVPANTCTAFPQTVWESRSSGSSFVSGTEDISLEHHTISNCGTIKITKHTDPRGLNQVFSYTSNLPTEPAGTVDGVPQGGVACPGKSSAGIQSDGSFCLNDTGNSTGDSAGNTVYTGQTLFAGTYTVTEGADPTGFVFESLSCNGGTTSTSGKTATITLAPGDNVTCTYTNKQQLGAIKITKTSIKGQGLDGATFSIKDSNGNLISGNPFTTANGGFICVDHLPFGTYSVQETAAPTGYNIDHGAAVSVPVDHNASCTSGTPNAPPPFTDTPLTDLTVTVTSEAPGGTKSTITCVNASATPIGNSPQGPAPSATVTANKLVPGDYTCTVHVDP